MEHNDPCMARSCVKSTKVSVYRRAKYVIWWNLQGCRTFREPLNNYELYILLAFRYSFSVIVSITLVLNPLVINHIARTTSNNAVGKARAI